MEYIDLANTDIRASKICLGTALFGTSINKDDSFVLMDAFLDAGGNFLDTAHIYADWQSDIPGMSERTIGEWISSRGCRDKVVLATKGAHPAYGTSVPRLHPREVNADLRESLRRLQTDHIDIYWLHRDDKSIPVSIILDTLENARHEGLIRWYAASNWSVSRLKEAAVYAEQNNLSGMIASQIQWSLAKMTPEGICDPTMVEMDDDIYQYHLSSKMPVVAYSSQASGFFSGRYACDRPESGRPEVRISYGCEANWGRLERARLLADKLGLNANQVALAYLTSQPFPAIPIVGSRSVDQLMDSCVAGNIFLTPEQVDYLNCGK